ncbi:hypothetical protein AMTR_s00009p00257290 [Amborella trichopoda]|uniref:Transcription factor CBF/NF-Y/archaeal histone domain-containing protein n=1 Tax=Amborella trichopoda TaxID=13333 RepID=W1NI10_AMBTC|nr:hypothetical protein AMTR_s00009p00257290 [Amborella trichopoda]
MNCKEELAGLCRQAGRQAGRPHIPFNFQLHSFHINVNVSSSPLGFLSTVCGVMRQSNREVGMISVKGVPHALPLARIKKIMKRSGEDVRMISGEAPIVFAKACELFIEDIAQKSWNLTLRGKRRTLHKDDVAKAINATDVFDFLIDMVSSHQSNTHPQPTSNVLQR